MRISFQSILMLNVFIGGLSLILAVWFGLSTASLAKAIFEKGKMDEMMLKSINAKRSSLLFLENSLIMIQLLIIVLYIRVKFWQLRCVLRNQSSLQLQNNLGNRFLGKNINLYSLFSDVLLNIYKMNVFKLMSNTILHEDGI